MSESELETVDVMPLKKLGCGGDGALNVAWGSYRREFFTIRPKRWCGVHP